MEVVNVTMLSQSFWEIPKLKGWITMRLFAPVAKMVTIQILLSVVATRKQEIHQIDVQNAFVHGDLQEQVYMKLPPGFSKGQKGKVCRLQKSLYMHKQASHCWFAKLTSTLKQCSFCQSCYYSLFTYSLGKIFICVLVCVDDLL